MKTASLAAAAALMFAPAGIARADDAPAGGLAVIYSTSDAYTLPDGLGLPTFDQTKIKNVFGLEFVEGYCRGGAVMNGFCFTATYNHFETRSSDGDNASLSLQHPCGFYETLCSALL